MIRGNPRCRNCRDGGGSGRQPETPCRKRNPCGERHAEFPHGMKSSIATMRDARNFADLAVNNLKTAVSRTAIRAVESHSRGATCRRHSKTTPRSGTRPDTARQAPGRITSGNLGFNHSRPAAFAKAADWRWSAWRSDRRRWRRARPRQHPALRHANPAPKAGRTPSPR